MKKIDIGFLGYGTRALDALMADERFNVKYFLTPASRLCAEVYEAAERYKGLFDFEIIGSLEELTQKISKIRDVFCFLINACPFILTKKILSYIDFYNIHPGDLHTNRGHQPHLWSVMLDERETKICLHRVNVHIDLGEVIEDAAVKLNGTENSLEVLNMAEDLIPHLLDGLYKYLIGEQGIKYTVTDGIYRRIMTYEDYEITPSDSPSDISRKIRARYMHSGAFFVCGDKRIYADDIISLKDSAQEMLSYDKHKIIYAHNGFELTMSLKKITDLKGNIIFSR